MITPMSALSAVTMPQRPSQSTILTQEQSKKLESTLSNYDAKNLSDDNAKALVIEIKEMGIIASRDLHDALAKVGINARDLADKAGIRPKGPGGPNENTGGPPPPPKKIDETALTLLQEAMQSYAEVETEESFADILAAKLTENGYDSSKPIVDFYA